MSQRERTGQRDLIYNDWHRRDSLVRWLTDMEAYRCAAIDVDFCEWCTKCYQPIALVETQQSRTFDKPYQVTQNLARMAGIEGYVVSYWTTDDGLDVAGMRVQQIAPQLDAPVEMEPGDWARALYEMRVRHEMTSCTNQHAMRFQS